MARRRYQNGNVRKRGKRRPVWELQWWADYLITDGKIGRKRESMILAVAADVSLKQARKLAAEHLRPLNQGKLTPMATVTFVEFIEKYFVPNALPTLKQSTRKRYHSTLNYHLKPAFGQKRLCDISTLEIQTFVLEQVRQRFGMGSLQPSSKSHVENICQCKEVGTLRGGQSCNRGGVDHVFLWPNFRIADNTRQNALWKATPKGIIRAPTLK